jgi:hypothetical protein
MANVMLNNILYFLFYAIHIQSFFIYPGIKKNHGKDRKNDIVRSPLPLTNPNQVNLPELPKNLSSSSLISYFNTLHPEIFGGNKTDQRIEKSSLFVKESLKKIEYPLSMPDHDNKELMSVAENFEKMRSVHYFSQVLDSNILHHSESIVIPSSYISEDRSFLKKDFQLIKTVKTRSLRLVQSYCEDDRLDALGWVDANRNTALHVALTENLPDIFFYLLPRANIETVTAVNNFGHNILHLGVNHSRSVVSNIHQFFISHSGLEKYFTQMCHQQDHRNSTPFILACSYGYALTIEYFMNYSRDHCNKKMVQYGRNIAYQASILHGKNEATKNLRNQSVEENVHSFPSPNKSKNYIRETKIDYAKTINLLDVYLNLENHNDTPRSFGNPSHSKQLRKRR